MNPTRAVAGWLLLTTSLAIAQAPAVDPVAAALRDARTAIASKDFAAAAKTLENGLAEASSITSGARRDQAFTALHFYAAVAYSGVGDDANARRHLNEYFRLSPKSGTIDSAKYQPKFVALFNELSPARHPAEPDSFEMYYPPFTPSPAQYLERFDAVAVDILGTSTEKHQWHDVATAEDRQRFIQNFWIRRDPSPDTAANELRDTFAQRFAYAESTFGVDEKGALADRGRVFTLLGRPSFVRRRPITSADTRGHNALWLPPDTMVNGTIEQWIYDRDQLPVRITKPSITYRFVTQQGIGNGVLQREEAYAMQALESAGDPLRK